MPDVQETAQQIYGDSWESFLEKASESANDQPIEESDNDSSELQDTEDIETSDTEGDEDQPDTESESEESVVEDDPEIDLGGDRKPVKLSELKEGYMRTSDYTKKTQELATQRKELDTQREGLKTAIDFQTHMESNPWLWEQVNGAIASFNDSGVLPIEEALQDSHYGKYINQLMAENNKLKKDLEGVTGERDGLNMTYTMSKLERDLKAEYGDLVTEEYMTKLTDRAKSEKLSPETLKEIADGHLAKQSLSSNKKDVTTATKKAEAKAIQKLAETKRIAPDIPRNTGARPSKEQAAAGGSWGDFFKTISR